MREDRKWLHDKEQVAARAEEFRAIYKEQVRVARRDVVPSCAICTTVVMSVSNSYRCFECGLWLCSACSRDHFPASAGARFGGAA